MSERIVVMSDTAISDRDAIRSNLIPGRLKSVVVGPKMTISYAGLSSQALDTIRNVHRNGAANDEAAIACLLSACHEYLGRVEFLFCSHNALGIGRLVKVTSSGAAEGASRYWIGDGDAARTLSNLDVKLAPVVGQSDYVSPDEIVFTRTFSAFLERHSNHLVGGAAINCLCSAHGHCYQNEAGAFMLTPIQIPDPVSPEIRAAEERSGMSRFSYHVYGADDRGVAVVGYYLEQAQTGYLYIPMEHDDALKVEARDQAEFKEIVTAAGRARARP